jgi:ribonuclease P/MRP protein subunit POP3
MASRSSRTCPKADHCNPSFLSPIGRHRSQHVQPSRGKRGKKRKRKEDKSADSQVIVPPAPEVGSFVDIGLSTVTRSLQASAARDGTSAQAGDSDVVMSDGARDGQIYSAVFVARAGYPNVLSNHLPQMVAVASASHSSSPPTRLVGLSKACQDRLSDALGIPRVSCIGLREGASNSKALLDYTREHVPVTVGAWLREAHDADYKDTKINTIETTVGTSKQKRK